MLNHNIHNERNDQLATHRDPHTHTHTAPFSCGPMYELIDCWLTSSRWRNTITNIVTDGGTHIKWPLPMTVTHTYELANIRSNTNKNKKHTKHTINNVVQEVKTIGHKRSNGYSSEHAILTKEATMWKDDTSQESSRFTDERAELNKNKLKEAN